MYIHSLCLVISLLIEEDMKVKILRILLLCPFCISCIQKFMSMMVLQYIGSLITVFFPLTLSAIMSPNFEKQSGMRLRHGHGMLKMRHVEYVVCHLTVVVQTANSLEMIAL
ncbi:unnamed protein product [Eruca vesicaria subsp. sativa]|uniref:Uncharacterized protein n=1 Tax=Eruca vesicaria subsp. sativa TaxID=29727 RepID=A0ABC8K674_ERUVS|nr:unnamed protein product [Eruca vesicaria subsp. sativa]